MSDGPYKSLPMPLGWRRFAKVAEREAYSEDEMSHTLRDALEADWQNCIPESLMRMVGDVLSGEQTDFLRDQRTELLDLLRKEDPGQSLRITFLDHVVHSVTNGYFGKEALVDAAQCTLVDHAQRGARQVKEHYHRKATQGHPVAIGRRIQRAGRTTSSSPRSRRKRGTTLQDALTLLWDGRVARNLELRQQTNVVPFT